MCIRDRKKKAQKRPNIDPQLSKLILWYFGCAALWLLFGTCLLYTSDAADERSSVDLGGRRIIKKKKKDVYVGALTHLTT